MKIANDLFLWCIGNYFDKINEEKLADKVRKKITHDISVKKKFVKEFDFYKAMKHYLKQNEDLKCYLEKLTEEMISAASSDEDEDNNSKLLGKKNRKESVNSKDQLSHNNKKFKVSSADEEENTQKISKKKRKQSVASVVSIKKNKKSKKNAEEDDDISDFSIDPQKIKAKLGLKDDINIDNKANQPFKRIDENLYKVHQELNCNSWETYAQKSGNNFAVEANNKLKVTAGKDFKKEKGKFKNKSGMGGGLLSTDVKSFKFVDSDDE